MARIRTRACALAAACFALCLGAVPAHAADPVVAAAGDISCNPDGPNFNGGNGTTGANPLCHQKYTADLVDGPDVNRVLALGDTQYEEGTLDQFQRSYALSWGQLPIRAKTSPAIGNHEYLLSEGTGYFDYFNGVGQQTGPAGERGKGYYSFDIGEWHLIALNSMCNRVPGGCGTGSPQERWLRADLSANADNSCTLAYWHHPLFNSGTEGNYSDTPWDTTALWQALYDGGAEIVLNGHAHHYERFAPQAPAGNADAQLGVREFIVGTGGKSLRGVSARQPNSQRIDDSHYGVIKLALHPNSYDWSFVDEAGNAHDPGSASCHGAPDHTPPETSITSGPQGATRETTATFSLASSEAGSNFACRLDAGAWKGCGSPAGYTGLDPGAHTFETRATDASGNVDPTPAVRSFTVDAVAPDTTITSGPNGRTAARRASFSFTPSEEDATFECRLDDGAWKDCDSPAGYDDLTSGEHTFKVRAVDAAGNVDRSPSARNWSVRRRKDDRRPWSYKLLAGDVDAQRDGLRRLRRNDGRRLEIAADVRRSGPFIAGLETFTSLTDEQSRSLERLTLRYNGGASARGAAITVWVFNYGTDRWVKLFGPRRGRRDRGFRWSEAALADDYVSSRGTLRVRVRGKGRRAFRMRTDLLKLTVAY